jgi:uncharacterized protein involved in type VI secretion and phage assembly
MLSLFDHTLDCRIFNDPIAGRAFHRHRGAGPARADRRGIGVDQGSPYRARDYCVQYRESDLRFVQRLLEEEGIYYFFKHEETKHTLVLADSITGHETATATNRFSTRPKSGRSPAPKSISGT